MYNWYDTVIGQVGGIDHSLPIYISDAWNLSKCISYCNGKNHLKAGRNANPIIIDTHLYWAFTDEDKRKTPSQIAHEASGKLSELDGHDGSVVDKGAVGVVVGEYSCVLTEDSWAKAAANEKEGLVKQFGQAQTQRYQSRAGGSFFWTYRMVRTNPCTTENQNQNQPLNFQLTRPTGLDGRRRMGLQTTNQKQRHHRPAQPPTIPPRHPKPHFASAIPKRRQIRHHIRLSLRLLGRSTPWHLRALALRKGLASWFQRCLEFLGYACCWSVAR